MPRPLTGIHVYLTLWWIHREGRRSRRADTIAAFFLVQHEVSVSGPLPESLECYN